MRWRSCCKKDSTTIQNSSSFGTQMTRHRPGCDLFPEVQSRARARGYLWGWPHGHERLQGLSPASSPRLLLRDAQQHSRVDSGLAGAFAATVQALGVSLHQRSEMFGFRAVKVRPRKSKTRSRRLETQIGDRSSLPNLPVSEGFTLQGICWRLRPKAHTEKRSYR